MRDFRDITGRLPTRTDATTAQYQKTASMLHKQASSDTFDDVLARLDTTITWFIAQNQRWKPATLRQYRAALRLAIEDAVAHNRAGRERVDTWYQLIETAPAPLDDTRVRRTSARKRKNIRVSERDTLVRYLEKQGGKTNRLLSHIVNCLPVLGLRPCEIFGAEFDGTTLTVRCAKDTNGRSIGETREITVKSVVLKHVVKHMLKELKDFQIHNLTDAQRLQARLAKTLERACKACGIKKISLYTLRHQALANAKRTLEPAEASALAGHASQSTIIKNYATRRSGWKIKPLIAIDPGLAAKVRGDVTSYSIRCERVAPSPSPSPFR